MRPCSLCICVILQAHYYENFDVCPEGTLPKFEGDFDYLLSAMNKASLIMRDYIRSSALLDVEVTASNTLLVYWNSHSTYAF